MTVRRHAEVLVDGPQSSVISAVRAVLRNDARYVSTREIDMGSRLKAHDLTSNDRRTAARFVTTVRPSRWLLATAMTITVRPSLSSSGRTYVAADTRSQWFILGDIEGYYDEYLAEFLKAVRAEVRPNSG